MQLKPSAMIATLKLIHCREIVKYHLIAYFESAPRNLKINNTRASVAGQSPKAKSTIVERTMLNGLLKYMLYLIC